MPEEPTQIVDWMNLPHGAQEVSLWAGFHDAQIVSIQSNLLERTVILHLECDHLLEFHQLPLDMQFLLRLDGVQSARVVHYAVWPGHFSVPAGAAREEAARLIADYQSDATLATSPDNSVALRISGLLNYTSYRELFLRADRLTLARGDGQDLGIAGLLKMGEAYWDAFERCKNDHTGGGPTET